MKKRYAVCITNDCCFGESTGEMTVIVSNEAEARRAGRRYIRAWNLENGRIDYVRELADGESQVPFGRAPGY